MTRATRRFARLVSRLAADRRGASTGDYLLIVVGVAIAVVAILANSGVDVANLADQSLHTVMRLWQELSTFFVRLVG